MSSSASASASAFALASASATSSQRVPAAARLRNCDRGRGGSHSLSGRTTTGHTSGKRDLQDEEDSTRPPLSPRDPQVNVIKEAWFRAIVHEGVGEGGGLKWGIDTSSICL